MLKKISYYLLAVVCIAKSSEAAFRPPNPGEKFEDIVMAHEAYASKHEHFQAVGALRGDKGLFCTATLAYDNQTIITCAHAVKESEKEDEPLTFYLPSQARQSVLSPGCPRYRVMNWHVPSDFRHGGPDIAVGKLERDVEVITPAIIGNIPNDRLVKNLWHDIPSNPFIKADPRYNFSSATVGQVAPWDQRPESFNQDNRTVKAFNTYLEPSLYPIDDVGSQGFRSSIREAIPMVGEHLLGATLPGGSGAPLFVKNVKSATGPWRLIGIASTSGPHEYLTYATTWTPIANLKTDFLGQLGWS